MASSLQRRFWVLCGAAATAAALWAGLPGTAVDRAVFRGVLRGFANPPFFIGGDGSHAAPWNLRNLAGRNLADAKQAPVMVSLGDDPAGFFQSSPPSPIDMAVVLSNFQRLGATRAATAVVMAWDSPDPMGLAALDKVISRFDSLVMAVPLARGAVSESMPSALRHSSLALAKVTGDPALLPVVNRIPLRGVILGGTHTVAGFQSLDSEPAGKFAPLLARWDDRVVVAFPMLCVLQRLGLTVDDLEIRLGQFIRLGPDGPVVPIDRYGRLTVPLKPLPPLTIISAEALIDGGDGLWPPDAPQPVVLRDDRSAAEFATRAFSQNLAGLIATLASDRGLTPARSYHRLSTGLELGLLVLIALILAALCSWPSFARHLGFFALAGCCVGAQFLAAGAAALWLPGLPAIGAIACAAALAHSLPVKVVPLQPSLPAAHPAPVTPPMRPELPPAPAPPHPPPPPVPHWPPPQPLPESPPPPPPLAPPKKPRPPGKKRRR